jgi:hypothetical protein
MPDFSPGSAATRPAPTRNDICQRRHTQTAADGVGCLQIGAHPPLCAVPMCYPYDLTPFALSSRWERHDRSGTPRACRAPL